MFTDWIHSLFGSSSKEEELKKADETTDDSETAKEAIDPANPASTPGTREQDVRDEVQRAIMEAKHLAAGDDNLSTADATHDAASEITEKLVRGENDTGVIAHTLHQQAEIAAEVNRFALLNHGIALKSEDIDADNIVDNLHPSIKQDDASRSQKAQAWKSQPGDFFAKKPLGGHKDDDA